MHADLALEMTADLFSRGPLVCIPVPGLTMGVGVPDRRVPDRRVSLTFILNLFSAGIVMIAAGPWMLRTLTRYRVHRQTGIRALL